MPNLSIETSWQFSPYMIPLFVSLAIAITFAAYLWKQRHLAEVTALLVLILSIAQWSLCYMLEIGAADLPTKIFWGKMQYFGIAITPAAWFVVALYCTGRAHWVTRVQLGLLAIIPVLTLLLVWNTETHGLVWAGVKLDASHQPAMLEIRHGLWFWVYWAYSYLLLFFGSVLLLQSVFLASTVFRWQSGLLILAILGPWLGNLVYILQIPAIPNLDFTPILFVFSGVIIGWNVIGFKLLDIMPSAHRTIIDSMTDGVIVLDASNRIVDINPAGQRLFGFNTTRAIGKKGTQIFTGWPKLLDHYRESASVRDEITLRGANSNQQFFDMQISPIYNSQGQLTGRIMVLRDITARKEAEIAVVEARDKALEVSRLKSEILANVSHELRTPLSTILGYAELLEYDGYGPLAEPQKQTLRHIITSAQFLTDLVNELLDEARLEVGSLKLKNEPLSPRDLARAVEIKLRILAENKKLAFVITVANDVPEVILGDPHRLEQILVNLVGNAIKFTEQGQVSVQILCPDCAKLVIQVADTGEGIPPEIQPHIFEPFQQADGSVTRKHRGAGLGLSIVRQLTSLMDGQVTVASDLGQGSVFTILLPLQLPANPASTGFNPAA